MPKGGVMSKLLSWFLGFTKLGTLNDKLTGYRTQIIALATALSATAVIIAKIPDGGLPYILSLPREPEFQTAAGGWVAFFAALKGSRIENKTNPPA
jgi:hypothetical protein